jgi:CRP/FNR family transcriptional regulator
LTQVNPMKTNVCESVGPVGCRACDLHEICRLTGLLAFDAGRSRQSTGTLRPVKAGEFLFRAGDRAHKVYAVRQGLLKTVQVGGDGEEQILALNTPGEALGLEGLSIGSHVSDVIALQSVVCCELPLQLLGEPGARAAELSNALIRLLGCAVVPRPNFARGPIRRRVTNFLLDFGKRLANRGLDGRRFTLGLSRHEIAHLLGTRIESVSRAMQQLHRERRIQVRGKHVSLLAL